MSEEDNNTMNEKPDGFQITKQCTNLAGEIIEKIFNFTWRPVVRGKIKGELVPVLDDEQHDAEDFILFFGLDQVANVLSAKAAQQVLDWYKTSIEKFGGTFTDNARGDFAKLVQEGKITRLTKSEIEDAYAKVTAKILKATRDVAATMATMSPEQMVAWQNDVKLLMEEENRLKRLLDSVSRKRKTSASNDDDEDEE